MKNHEKVRKSRKIFEKKINFPSQNLVIWSGNSAKFSGLEAKKRKKKVFFVLGPKGQAPKGGPRLSDFRADELQTEVKTMQNEVKM